MHDILVHAVGYRDRDPAVMYAAHLAASQRATVTALYVPPAMPALPDYDVTSVVAAYAEWIQHEGLAAREAAPAFEAWAASLGAAHARWEVADGDVSVLLRHAGHWHDVLVLGVGGQDSWQSEAGAAQLVLTTGLPCIVVPQAAGGREAPNECIAVAWNGSIEAIGALHTALPLLQAAQRVVILSGTQRPAAAGLMRFDLDAWAEQHGVGIEYLMLDAGEDVGPALLEAEQEVAADLLVAGAYGRPRLAEWVLGGVTRHLLRHSTLPMLLRH